MCRDKMTAKANNSIMYENLVPHSHRTDINVIGSQQNFAKINLRFFPRKCNEYLCIWSFKRNTQLLTEPTSLHTQSCTRQKNKL